MTKSLRIIKGDCEKEWLKRWVFRHFLQNSQWWRRHDVLWQTVPQLGSGNRKTWRCMVYSTRSQGHHQHWVNESNNDITQNTNPFSRDSVEFQLKFINIHLRCAENRLEVGVQLLMFLLMTLKITTWCNISTGWWRGSVVKTSVFGRQTFPDLCPIYGWQVTTLWVNCPLWVSQLSLPSLQGR